MSDRPYLGSSSGGGTSTREVPAGTVDGVNAAFTLASAPASAASVQIYNNGILQIQGTAYTLVAQAITFQAGSIPQVGDQLQAYYLV